MMDTCLDEGTLQAYLDGELSPDVSNGVAAHLAACVTCAEAAHAAEQEFALFSTAFAPALSAADVPTDKLRARLDEAIADITASRRLFADAAAVETSASRRLRAFFASLAGSLTTFTPRQATAFASFLVAVALAVVFIVLMQRPDGPNAPGEIASNDRTPAPASPAAPIVNNPARGGATALQTAAGEVHTPAPARGGIDDRRRRAALVKAGLNARPQGAGTGENERGVGPGAAVAPPAAASVAAATTPSAPVVLADEKTYLSSIASLTSAIEAQGAAGMTPTLRAEYERNLAVVNQAIVSSRVAARRNPQDTDAKDFLRAAYQNKVELLSAVADQTQLASGRD